MARGHAYIQKNGSTENIGGSAQCQRMFVQEVSFTPIQMLGFGTEYLEYWVGARTLQNSELIFAIVT